MKRLGQRKWFRRIFYIGRITKFRKLVSVMVVAGLAFSMAYFGRVAYMEYAASRADIVLSFPQIAQSKYPNGSRFIYYDFVSDENLQAALDVMQAEGIYENFTVEKIRNSFFIYSYLEGSAGDAVSSARSEGNDFSYVANEYKITFIQPHDYQNPNLLSRFFGRDYSGDFLDALVEVNRVRIAEQLGGIDSFYQLTAVEDTGNYDYSEELNMYRTKIDTIIAYLDNLNQQEPSFVDDTHNLSLNDLQRRYAFLVADQLDGISDFVESSGISKDVELASNKLKVNIENNTLKYDKAVDRSQINDYAMTNYDQTFTENLINVVQNEQYGLYQARPKTAFDTVVNQKHEADESAAEYSAQINQYNQELAVYNTVMQTPEEHDRLIAKSDELMAQFRAEYQALSDVARQAVTSYYNAVNENYVKAEISDRELISNSLILKMGTVFVFGAAFAFVVMVFVWTLSDRRKVKRRKKLFAEIQRTTAEGGA